MTGTNRTLHIPIGIDVVGSDGQTIGHVKTVETQGFVVEKGTFFSSDHFIPAEAMVALEPDRVLLSITKEAALSMIRPGSAEYSYAEPDPADYDASGTATYAAEQAELRRQAGSAGIQTHMGESVDSPGLAGDLRERPHEGSDTP